MKKALILSVICHSEMEKWNFEGIVDENLTFMDDENVYKANYNSGKLKKKRNGGRECQWKSFFFVLNYTG